MIRLYLEGKIANYVVPENLAEGLASKAVDKRGVEKTEKEYNKIVGKYTDAESVVGRLKRLQTDREENYFLTMILFKEKDPDPKQEKIKSSRETHVNIDFVEGTTRLEALESKSNIRAQAVKAAASAADTVETSGRGKRV